MNSKDLPDTMLIAEVVALLAHTHDDKDWEAFRSLLTPEVHIDLSDYLGVEPMTVAAQEAADRLSAALNGFHSTHHTTSDAVIKVEGSTAAVHSHITAYFYLPRADDAPDYCALRGTWDIRLRKTDDRWLVEKMVIKRTTPWDGDPGLFALAFKASQQKNVG